MCRALAILTLCSAILGVGTVDAGAGRLGPFCFSLVPTSPSFFPALTLELFLDSDPYGQVYLGTARTLNTADTPSFVTLQVVGRFVRISIVGTPFLKPAFAAGGQLDTQANPLRGDVEITITDPAVGPIVNNQVVPVGTLPATMTLISCS